MIHSEPEPGHYVVRFKTAGTFYPARIWRPCTCSIHGGGDEAIDPNARHNWRHSCDRYPRLAAEIDGKRSNLEKLWNTILIFLHEGPVDEAMVANMSGRWCMKIDPQDYDYVAQDLAWCREYAPDQVITRLSEYYRIDKMAPIEP